MGGAGAVCSRFNRHYFLFFLAGLTLEDHVNNFIVPFIVALIAFSFLFIGLDTVIMKAQGLSLLFHQ